MNTLNLNAYGVSEMNSEELSEVYGGGWAGTIGKAIGYAVGYVAACIEDAVVAHGQDVAGAGNAGAVVACK
ncbi:hypothetical protein FACS189413_12420 [Bacteroidia bacterium]|nr:hypothetical protein FACS189413_12420 [Bacteroidia bacterium]